jgi:hypothetical protein
MFLETSKIARSLFYYNYNVFSDMMHLEHLFKFRPSANIPGVLNGTLKVKSLAGRN